MGSPGQPQSQPTYLPAPELPPRLGRHPLARPRAWLGYVVAPIITLLSGIVIGVVGLFLYTSSFVPAGPVVVPTPSPGGDIVVQVGFAYITRILQKDLHNLKLSGDHIVVNDIENVQVMFADSDQLAVTGNAQISIWNLKITGYMKFIVQLSAQQCHIRVYMQGARVGNFSILRFIPPSFEGQIDQQLQTITDGLPPDLNCVNSVLAKPEGVFVALSATPEVTPSAIPTATPKVTPTATPKISPSAIPTTTPTVPHR